MRFVPLKQAEQQALLAVHRARAGFVKARTAQANQLCGLLAEFGVVIPQGLTALRLRLPVILTQTEHDLPDMMRQLVARLAEYLKLLEGTGDRDHGWGVRHTSMSRSDCGARSCSHPSPATKRPILEREFTGQSGSQ